MTNETPYTLACGHTVMMPHGGSARCEPCAALAEYLTRQVERSEYDDEWCCRRCHVLAREMAPLAPGEPEPRVKYRAEDCVMPPASTPGQTAFITTPSPEEGQP